MHDMDKDGDIDVYRSYLMIRSVWKQWIKVFRRTYDSADEAKSVFAIDVDKMGISMFYQLSKMKRCSI